MATIYVYFAITVLLTLSLVDQSHAFQDDESDKKGRYNIAQINITASNKRGYNINNENGIVTDSIKGNYGLESKTNSISGSVLHIENYSKTGKKNHFGCSRYNNSLFPPTPGNRIALVKRGECSFNKKFQNALEFNASAVIIYHNESKQHSKLMVMSHNHLEYDIISVFISKEDGEQMEKWLDEGKQVNVRITYSGFAFIKNGSKNGISRMSVLFVSISFIVLMIISLAWLLFYYIKRFRYSHAKERLAKRLAAAAKKAIAKIPQKSIKNGDKELESDFDQCAVCIEPYKAQEIVRILPCRHVFHKSCIDPWLLDQRSCPMCKLDILRAYGMQIGDSQDSVPADTEAQGTNETSNDEVEMISSVEAIHSEQTKVFLMPDSASFAASAQEGPSTSHALGAVGGCEEQQSSETSTAKSSGKSSRVEKSEEQHDEQEMTALISNSEETPANISEEKASPVRRYDLNRITITNSEEAASSADVTC